MKLSIKFAFFIAFLTAYSLSAQDINNTAFTISGKVIDHETQQTLEYATIVLENTTTQKISGGITNSKGEFTINAPKANYNITVEYIGFQSYKLINKEINEITSLGTIALKVDHNSLDEVEIIAEKSTVEIRLDKSIYNVGKDMTVKGGTASDVLDNVPSVSVDVEGNVSLRGNENVRILINGKPSGLVGLSSTEALRQFPADAIAKVEVITSPSARYDAEGTAGIINIILRKGKGNGFNGSTTGTIGNPELYGLSGNLNYRNKKVNIFSTAGFRHRTGPGHSSLNTRYLDDLGNIESYRDEYTGYDRKRNSFNINLGTEVFLNSKSSITGTLLYRDASGENISTNNITDFDHNRVITATSRIREREDDKDKTFEYSLNFTNNIDDKGHKLTVDFQGSHNTEIEASTVNNYDMTPIFNQGDIITIIPENNNTEILFQGDYIKPIKENSQLEIGFRANLDDLNSDYNYDIITSEPNPSDLSNQLIFRQHIYAFYTQFGSKVKNTFSYLIGLRTEITDVDIRLKTTNQNYDKNYTQLFPTINLGYELSENQSVTLGYSRRLRRPRSFFLNPFRSFTSQTNYFEGNVELDPTYTNAFDLGYLKKWNRLTLNSSIYFQHTTNNFQFVSQETGEFVDGIPVIRRTPINLTSEDRYGFEFNANYNPSNKIRLSGSFNFYQFKTDGVFSYTDTNNNTISQNFNGNNTSWTARFNTKITLPGKIDWQTRMFYRAPQENTQRKTKGRFSTNLAFSKDVFKEKGTLTLNVSDLFNSRKRQSTNYTDSTISESEFQWRARQINLNFTYRFNEQKKRVKSSGYDNPANESGGF